MKPPNETGATCDGARLFDLNCKSTVLVPPKEINSILLLATAHRLVRALQRPLEAVFWALEQRKARLADRIANMGVRV